MDNKYNAGPSLGGHSPTLSASSTMSLHHHRSQPQLSSSPKKQARDVFETILKGRRSWKTLRDGDLVWPPELESALLEGLESYQPDDSRETRLLGRFPRRNRFISDYILHTTGKLRTPKQVGSRLQQLRDTTGGKQLLKLLCPPRRPSPSEVDHLSGGDFPMSPTSPLDSDYSLASDGSMPATPTTPGMPHLTPHLRHSQQPSSRTVICIEVLPSTDDLTRGSPRLGQSTPCGCGSRSSPVLSESKQGGAISFFRPSSHARHLRCIDPTITFSRKSTTSSRLSDCLSVFRVCLGGQTVHKDSIPLDFSPSMVLQDGTELYSCLLVPRYWETICRSQDPTQYTIYHEVVNQAQQGVLFAATYKFVYPSPSRSTDGVHSSPPITPPLAHQHHISSNKFSGHHYSSPESEIDDLLVPIPPQCPPMDTSSMYNYMRPEEYDAISNPGRHDNASLYGPSYSPHHHSNNSGGIQHTGSLSPSPPIQSHPHSGMGSLSHPALSAYGYPSDLSHYASPFSTASDKSESLTRHHPSLDIVLS